MAVFQILFKVLFASIAVYTLVAVGKAIYNITFHPLAKYPGPKLDGAIDFPWHWRQTRGYQPFYMKSLHEKHGNIVRVAPNQLSYINSQAWRDICGPQKGRKHLIRDPLLFAPPRDQPPNIILSTDMDHTRFRRALGFSFSDGALREQEPLVQSYCNLLISRLNDQFEGKPEVQIDIVRWLNFTTFDIVGDLVFSESFHALEKGEYHEWMSGLFKAMKVIVLIQSASSYPIVDMFLTGLLKRVPAIQRARARNRNYTIDKVTRRLESKVDHKDFMSHIVRHNDEKGLTKGELVSNSSILIMAGSETTATCMSGLMFLLTTNPDKMSALQREVRSAFKSQEEMTFANEGKLPYLHACLQEALRIYPPAPQTFARYTPPEGIVIDGQFVPGNVSVGVHQLAAFHSGKNFKDPLSFVPERWLGDENYASDDLEVVRPFGMGAHYCLGVKLAYAEMGSIMTRLIWNFNMELCEDSKDFLNQKIYMLWEKPALNIKISSRF